MSSRTGQLREHLPQTFKRLEKTGDVVQEASTGLGRTEPKPSTSETLLLNLMVLETVKMNWLTCFSLSSFLHAPLYPFPFSLSPFLFSTPLPSLPFLDPRAPASSTHLARSSTSAPGSVPPGQPDVRASDVALVNASHPSSPGETWGTWT